MANSDYSLDALVPAEMAVKAEEVGVKKANMPFMTTFVLLGGLGLIKAAQTHPFLR